MAFLLNDSRGNTHTAPVVVATELAQQEEAHGDSKEKVKLDTVERNPVDRKALDWHTP